MLAAVLPGVLLSSRPHWGSLPCCRGRQLEESLEYMEFLQNAEEEEAWISEKEAMVTQGGSGDTLAMTQVSHRLNDQYVPFDLNLFLSSQHFIMERIILLVGEKDDGNTDTHANFKYEK